MPTDTNRSVPAEWAFTFHGHCCPFMPLVMWFFAAQIALHLRGIV